MHNKFLYKSHNIDVIVSELENQTYGWSFTIDGGHYEAMKDRPFGSQELILNEGLGEAQRFVDSMTQG